VGVWVGAQQTPLFPNDAPGWSVTLGGVLGVLLFTKSEGVKCLALHGEHIPNSRTGLHIPNSRRITAPPLQMLMTFRPFVGITVNEVDRHCPIS
jgi:hypothetical protein